MKLIYSKLSTIWVTRTDKANKHGVENLVFHNLVYFQVAKTKGNLARPWEDSCSGGIRCAVDVQHDYKSLRKGSDSVIVRV